MATAAKPTAPSAAALAHLARVRTEVALRFPGVDPERDVRFMRLEDVEDDCPTCAIAKKRILTGDPPAGFDMFSEDRSSSCFVQDYEF